MFGGIAFMVRGNMCCGVQGSDLRARIGPDEFEAMLKKPHARDMDFTGKPLRGFLYVDQAGLEYASGAFDDAFAAGGVGACRALAKQMGRDVMASAEWK